MTKRILIVDDETCFTELVAMNLEDMNAVEVQCVNNPLNCIAVASQWKPDLILLDWIMPGMNGGEIFSQLQADDELKEIPIIFLSASASAQGIIQGPHITHLPKPMTTDALLQAIDLQIGLRAVAPIRSTAPPPRITNTTNHTGI